MGKKLPVLAFLFIICIINTACTRRERHELRKFSLAQVTEAEVTGVSEKIITSASSGPTTVFSKQPLESGTVYITKTGKRYHISKSCAGANGFECGIDEAVEKGLTPCKKCTEQEKN